MAERTPSDPPPPPAPPPSGPAGSPNGVLGTNGASDWGGPPGSLSGANANLDEASTEVSPEPLAGAREEEALPPPPAVADLADACVRFVEAAVGLRLDYRPETLPVLDHYLAGRRKELVAKPEAVGLVARAVGAYFGEVVRRHLRCFWEAVSDDPTHWELRFEPVFLAFHPLGVAYDAITHGDEEGATAHFQLDDEDRDAVEARLAELPEASDEEFFALSTRLEVLEIAVDAVKARMMSNGLGEVSFTSADYDDA
ncbi:MAG TPA: hypothetical protein VJT73_17980 [Polyangiaceae bacterium]|nr:hypothetical protein [Polyangiaceae bacterium]